MKNMSKLDIIHIYLGQIIGQFDALIFECEDNKIPSLHVIEARKNLELLKILVEDERKKKGMKNERA